MSVEHATLTDDGTDTVWVVTKRADGDPHSHVEAVYTDEEAAREHKRHLADNAFQHGAIAWGVHEQPVSDGFDADGVLDR